jgi:hypothetical protein
MFKKTTLSVLAIFIALFSLASFANAGYVINSIDTSDRMVRPTGWESANIGPVKSEFTASESVVIRTVLVIASGSQPPSKATVKWEVHVDKSVIFPGQVGDMLFNKGEDSISPQPTWLSAFTISLVGLCPPTATIKLELFNDGIIGDDDPVDIHVVQGAPIIIPGFKATGADLETRTSRTYWPFLKKTAEFIKTDYLTTILVPEILNGARTLKFRVLFYWDVSGSWKARHMMTKDVSLEFREILKLPIVFDHGTPKDLNLPAEKDITRRIHFLDPSTDKWRRYPGDKDFVFHVDDE